MKEKNNLKSPNYRLLKTQAYEMVVLQSKTQCETAKRLGVSEVTLSKWASNGKWRETANILESLRPHKNLLSDICEIEDKELRMRIVNKLFGEGL